MGHQHHVVHGQQFGGHVRFVGVDIESGAGDQAVPQGLYESGLVHAGTAAHVDEYAFRPQRVEHFEIDQAEGFRAAGQHVEQYVALPGQFARGFEIRKRRVFLAPAIVVGETQSERFGPAHDGVADPAEAENAERPPRQAGAEGKRPLAPFAGAHEAVGVDDIARGREDQRDRQIGHRVVEHVGGIRDRNAGRPRALEIDAVDADPETGQYAQRAQFVDDFVANPGCRRRSFAVSFEPFDQFALFGLGQQPQVMGLVARVEPGDGVGVEVVDDQQRGLVRHASMSLSREPPVYFDVCRGQERIRRL